MAKVLWLGGGSGDWLQSVGGQDRRAGESRSVSMKKLCLIPLVCLAACGPAPRTVEDSVTRPVTTPTPTPTPGEVTIPVQTPTATPTPTPGAVEIVPSGAGPMVTPGEGTRDKSLVVPPDAVPSNSVPAEIVPPAEPHPAATPNGV